MQEPQHNREIHVLDIRPKDASRQFADEIIKGLGAPFNKKTLPTKVLYDEVGLNLFDKFSAETPDYRPFVSELEIFKLQGDGIMKAMHSHTSDAIVPGEAIVELGAGSLRKTSHLLRALSDMVPTPLAAPPVTYFALDLDGNELKRALNEVHNSDIGPSLSGKVETKGLWGTYENGFEFIASGGLGSSGKGDGPTPVPQATSGADTAPTTFPGQPPIYYLFLGGNIGSFYRGDDSRFLRAIPLRPGDRLLLAVGHIHERSNLHNAYSDPNGYSKAFAMNGLSAAGNALKSPGLFNHDDWTYEYISNDEKCCFEGFYKCLRTHEICIPAYNQAIPFLEGELVRVCVSANYSESDIHKLFNDGQVQPIQHWVDSTNRRSIWLLERPLVARENGSSA